MRVACLSLIALAAVGCTEAPSDDTPSGALRMFLDAMERSERDPEALQEAYALLAAPARHGLQERAHLATSLGGREFEPWEMLVRGRFRRTFTARESHGMEERVDGDEATVVVRGDDGQVARVPMALEDEGWRVVLAIPPARGD